MARRGTKRVVVKELVKEEHNECSETGAFNELKASLALPRQSMPMYVEVRWVREEGKKPASTLRQVTFLPEPLSRLLILRRSARLSKTMGGANRTEYITAPRLYAHNLPNVVNESHLRGAFVDFVVTRIVLSNGCAEINFEDMAEARLALAVCYHRKIHLPARHVLLELSPHSDSSKHFLRSICSEPRLVKGLPSNLRTPFKTYDTFHQFVPIAIASVSKNGSTLIWFWTESDAYAAEKMVINSKLWGNLGVRLQAIDPCSVYCSNLPAQVDKRILENFFEELQPLPGTRIKRSARGRSFGFVSFRSHEAVLTAVDEWNEQILFGNRISVEFCEARTTPCRGRRRSYSSSRSRSRSVDGSNCSSSEPAKKRKRPGDDTERVLSTIDVDHDPEADEARGNGQKFSTAGDYRGMTEEMDLESTSDYPPREPQEGDHPQENSCLQLQSEDIVEDEVREKDYALHTDDDVVQRRIEYEPGGLTGDDAAGPDVDASRSDVSEIEYLRTELAAFEELRSKEKEGHQLEMKIAENRLRRLEREKMDLEATLRSARAEREDLDEKLKQAARELSEMERRLRELKRAEEDRAELEERLGQVERDRDRYRAESEDWQHQYTLALSKIKMMEMEADRPLWEQSRRARGEGSSIMGHGKIKELEDKLHMITEEVRKLHDEKRRKEQEDADAKLAELEEREREDRERAHVEAWKKATAAERTRCRERDACWDRQYWKQRYALERFKVVAEEFCNAKFSETQPLTRESVPWPTMDNPTRFELEDLDWRRVEDFFRFVEVTCDRREYRELVKRAHPMFHPDKWRARKLLETVIDTEERDAIDKGCNIVSQALSPLWRKIKEYEGLDDY